MNVSIIGTNGFLSDKIGRYCNENNINIVSYGRTKPLVYDVTEFVPVNLVESTIDADKLAQSDIVIYTCGAGIQSNLKESWYLIYRLNTLVPIELSASLSDAGFKGTLVTFGSYFEIGNNEDERLFDESAVSTSLLETPNHYCLSKRLLTRFVSSTFVRFKHLHIILPTIYGHGEASHRIIPYTINSILNKTTQSFTSGYQIRQYLYAGDIPPILINLINLDTRGIINLPGEETYSIRQLIQIIYTSFGQTVDDNLFGKAAREDVGMQNLQLDGSLLRSLLPNIRYTPLEEALKYYDK